jgi:hypothetical protein
MYSLCCCKHEVAFEKYKLKIENLRLTQGEREKKRREMTHYVPYILVHMPHELKLGYVNLS